MISHNSSEIIRVKRLPSSFVQMHKGFLEDPHLSYKAKGILAYLLTKPDGWIVMVADIIKHGKDGKESTYNGLKELQTHGYYKRKQIRNDKGQIAYWESIICEVPIWTYDSTHAPSPSPHPENPEVDRTMINTAVSPYPGFPEVDKPYVENPSHSNNYLTKNNLSNNYQNTSSQSYIGNKSAVPIIPPFGKQDESLPVKTAQGTGQTSVNHSMTLAEQWYELFWTAYPRKSGKKDGMKAWKKLRLDEALYATIMSALNESIQWWQSNKTDMRYIPYPANWLTGEHWKNEVFLSVDRSLNNETTQSSVNQCSKQKRSHNFAQRQHDDNYFATLENLERQYLLNKLSESGQL